MQENSTKEINEEQKPVQAPEEEKKKLKPTGLQKLPPIGNFSLF